MIKSSKIKAVIFDYDGVLVDSRDTGLLSYQAIARHLGAAGYASLQEFRHDQQRRYREILHEWGAKTPEQIEQAEAIYRTTHSSALISPLPGIQHILESLSKKYKLAIVSGTYREIIEASLKRHGLSKYFTHVIGANDVKNNKPAPDSLLLCLQKFNIQPHEAVFIGDMVIDILAGRSAGVKTAILTSHSWNAVEDLKAHNPDMLLEKPEHIMQVIK